MPINKVAYNNEVLVDMSNVTVTADVLKSGYTALDKNGELIVGAYEAEQLEPAEGVGF